MKTGEQEEILLQAIGSNEWKPQSGKYCLQLAPNIQNQASREQD